MGFSGKRGAIYKKRTLALNCWLSSRPLINVIEFTGDKRLTSVLRHCLLRVLSTLFCHFVGHYLWLLKNGATSLVGFFSAHNGRKEDRKIHQLRLYALDGPTETAHFSASQRFIPMNLCVAWSAPPELHAGELHLDLPPFFL